MMNDPWTDRLSAYLDGDLPAHERTEIEAHLAACDACSTTLRELQAVIAAAAALQDEQPATDLWPGIAARLSATVPAAGAAGIATESLSARPSRRATVQYRRFSFTTAQLAAAAVVLMILSGGSVWMLQTATAPAQGAGTVVHSAGDPANVQLVGTSSAVAAAAESAAFADDVAELERTLDEYRDRLDPATIDVVERSLESIDGAILDARTALEADPGNENLNRQLDSTMRKKVELLRRVTRGAS